MNRKNHRLCTAVIAPALLALSLLTSSCVEPLDPSLRGSTDPNAVSLPIRLYIPGAMPVTKAGSGDVAGVSPESQVYRVQVWMFDHQAATAETYDSQKAVAYAEADLNTSNTANLGPYDRSGYYDYATWESDKIFRLPLMIPGYVLERSADKMKFDFYVLANAASVGCTAGRESTRRDLKALTFGYTSTTVDPFGPYGPKTGTTPTSALGNRGLPISGFFNKSRNDEGTAGDPDGVDLSFLKPETLKNMNPAQITAKSPVVQMERAVSKIRFVIAAPNGMTGMSVTGIEVNGGLIPKQTYLFPREKSTTKFELPTNAADATYDAKTISVTVPTPIPATIVDPKYLMSTSEKDFTIGTTTYNPSAMTGTDGAQQYSDFLTAAVGAGYATETYVYLRESDYPITGEIKYKLSADANAPEYTATFDMTKVADYSADNTNFHRNHSWTVYAYFEGGGLYIKPLVMPWENRGQYDFTTPGTAYVAISDKSQSLFGYGWSSSNDNDWYTVGKNTEWYFRRLDKTNPTTEDDWKDWVNSQIVVAPGANVANTPVFANRIELHTNGFTEPLRLKLTNTDDFYLVVYHDDTTDNTYEVIDSEAGALIPDLVAANGITYFYVAPKEDAEHPDNAEHLDKTTSAYLITGTTGQKIPFNPGAFPGSNDNSEIHFYSVSQNTFKDYYTSLPDNVRAYGKGAALVNILP